MRALRRPVVAFLAGSALTTLALISMGQSPTPSAKDWEYSIRVDVEEKDVAGMASDGWEFVGYLGQGVKGTGSDETLWRRLDD